MSSMSHRIDTLVDYRAPGTVTSNFRKQSVGNRHDPRDGSFVRTIYGDDDHA